MNYTSYNDVVIHGSFGGNLTSVIATIQVDSRNADGLKKCHCIASAFNGTDNESKVKSILLLASIFHFKVIVLFISSFRFSISYLQWRY